VAVRLGPVALSFAGTAKFEEVDQIARKAQVKAQGADVKGRGGANAIVKFALEPATSGTKVMVNTDLNLSGSVAQYGRASGMIQSVAAQLIGQFATALRHEISDGVTATMVPEGGRPPSAPVTSEVSPLAGKPINGLSLLLSAFGQILRSMFGRVRGSKG
jgi:carbon monoxide dehydrogenase subunit G